MIGFPVEIGPNQNQGYPIKSGLTVEDTMEWLNVTKSYVYKLVRNKELQAIKTDPMIIEPSSVIRKIGSTYPLVAHSCKSILDYQVKQDAIHAAWNRFHQSYGTWASGASHWSKGCKRSNRDSIRTHRPHTHAHGWSTWRTNLNGKTSTPLARQ